MSKVHLLDSWASQVLEDLPDNAVFLVTENLAAYTLVYAQVWSSAL
jgi:hypothetical protein